MNDEQLRLALIAWLETNDRNGCYSDDDCIAEGFPVMTLISAIENVHNELRGEA